MKKIPNKNVSAQQNFKKWIENKIVSAQTLRFCLEKLILCKLCVLSGIQVWSRFCSSLASIYGNHNWQKQYWVKMKEIFNLTLWWELLYSLQLFYLQIEVLTFSPFQLVEMAVLCCWIYSKHGGFNDKFCLWISIINSFIISTLRNRTPIL